MDVHYIETADGVRTYFSGGVLRVMSFSGYGMPPVAFISSKSYRQVGVTELDYHLDPRDFSVSIWQKGACDRQEYWDNRAALLGIMRSNRGGPLTVGVIQPDGQHRAILARPYPGPMFPLSKEDNTWNINEEIRFMALDPTWFNPSGVLIESSGSESDHLVFDIDFSIQFGTEGLAISTGDFIYGGDWVSYPIITIHGPYDTALAFNSATGAQISLNTPITASELRRIILTPGAQRVEDSDGVNKFSEMDADSNILDFGIYPDPQSPGGVNRIDVIAYGETTSLTTISVSYNERFIGI